MASKENSILLFLCLMAMLTCGIIGGCTNSPGVSDSSGPPEIISTNPSDDTNNISVTTSVSAIFNQPVDGSSINDSTFILRSDTDTLSGTISTNDTTAVLTLSDSLAYGTTYRAILLDNIRDASGESLPNEYRWTFSTEEISDRQEDDGDGENNGDQNDDGEDNNDGIGSGDQNDGSGDGQNEGDDDDNNGNSEGQGDGSDDEGDENGNDTEEDNIRPTVVASSPENGDSDLPVDIEIEVTFSEEVDLSTIHLTLYDPNTHQGYDGSMELSGNVLTFTPDSSLTYRSYFNFLITQIEDHAGNNMMPEFSMEFSTEDPPVTTPPVVEASSPSNGADEIPINTDISVTFSEDIDPRSVNENTVTLEGPNGAVPFTARAPNERITISPDNTLKEGSSYTYTVSYVRDIYENVHDQEYSATFTTEGQVDDEPPVLVRLNPETRETGVSTDVEVIAIFSEEMDPATINSETIMLEGPSGNVSGTVGISGDEATFTPDIDLDYGTEYSIIITNGVTDLVGNPIPNNVSSIFKTEEAAIAGN